MSKAIRRASALAVVSVVSWAVAVLAPPTYTTYQVTDNLSNDTRADVALDADGNPHAVYVRDGVLYYKKGLDPEVIIGSPSGDPHPAIAVGADRVHIVCNSLTVNPLVYYCRGFDGSVIVNGEEIGTRVSWGDLDVDSSGFVHIVYLSDASFDGYADVCYVNNTSGSFGSPTVIFNAQDINPYGACHFRWWYDRPAIQIDGDDKYHIVAWQHDSESGCGGAIYHYYRIVYATNRSGGWVASSAAYTSGLALGRNPICVDVYLTAGVVYSVGSTAYYWRPGTAIEITFCTGTNPAISLVGYTYEAIIAYEDAILTGQITYVTYDALNNRFFGYTTIGAGSLPAVAAGSLFVYFEKSDGEDSEIYVYTDATLTPSWQISVSVDPSAGGGSVSGGGLYDDGAPVTVTATPATACYEFVRWTEGTQTASTSASYTFTAAADRSLVASFQNIYYTITVSADPASGGTATFPSGESGSKTYPCSAGITVSALANAGYEFANWTEDGSWVSDNADYNLTVSADRALVAHFNQTQCTLTVDVNPAGGGDVTVEVVQAPSATATSFSAKTVSYPYQIQYAAGTTVRLTALAGEGYEYDEFTGDTGTANPSGITSKGGPSGSIEVVMDRDRSITGNFEAIPKHTLTLNVAPSGGGDVAATALPKGIVLPFPGHTRSGYPLTIDYYEGTQVQIDATAGPGFEFANFTGDLDPAATSGAATQKGGATGQTEVVMDQDRSITANFSAIVGLFFEDFEDVSGWTATGLWHIDDDPSCTACGTLDETVAHYARRGACDYATGARTAGALTSPVILLKGAKSVELSFDYFRHVAPFAQNLFADMTSVEVRLGRGMWRTVWQKSTWNRSPECGSFKTRISAGIATTLQLRFVFDSRNRYYNNYPGWAIDNVKVRDTAVAKPLADTSVVVPGGTAREGLYTLTYPNPVRDVHTTTFAVRGADVERIHLRIYSLAGQLIYEEEGPGSELDWHTDTSGGEYVANGIYIYAVEARIDDEWIHFPLQTVAVLK